ncbi:MAG: hypothetical protein RLZZ59_232 [Pseudomonadota bacterium]|jgi:ubiquinone biosynthesis protein COQ9
MVSIDQERKKIIKAVLPFVLDEGWNSSVCEKASESIDKDKRYYLTLFSDISSVVDFFEQEEDIRMLEELHKINAPEKIREKIKLALMLRLGSISGGSAMLKKLEDFYLNSKRPLEFTNAASHIWRTSDVIWKYAGDQSLDFNYYTKRVLLAGVYTKVINRILHHGEQNIEEYIAMSLDKVINFGSLKRYFKIPKIEDIPILRMFL